MFFKKTELRKSDRTVGVSCNIFYPIFRQARPDFFRPCLTKYWIKCITANPNRTVSHSKFSFFQAFAFADQILPGSGTFDLSVGPFSLSKV